MINLIKKARIINPALGQDFVGDILIIDGKITQMSENINYDKATIFNAENLVVAPGLVDMHVHLRDPGLEYKEDIISGCNAAVAGGITSVLCMPNTSPSVDTSETVEYILNKSKKASAKVYVAAGITKKLMGSEKTNLEEIKKSGAIAITDDGRPTVDTSIMLDAMKKADELGMRVVAHCEDLYLAKNWLMNEGETSKKLGIKAVHNAAEDTGTAREIALATALNVPIHICHVSTGNSANMIRNAKKDGFKVSGETAPHYLLMTDKELETLDADYRMNPPLRCENDRQKMVEAVLDGTIEVIATDHAPHSVDEKSDFNKSPNGVIGMETSLAGTITALGDKVSLSKIVELMSVNPAKILGIDAGVLKVGGNADIVIFDPNEKWTVDINKLHGKSKNAIFKNRELTGKVKYTFVNGQVKYNDKED